MNFSGSNDPKGLEYISNDDVQGDVEVPAFSDAKTVNSVE